MPITALRRTLAATGCLLALGACAATTPPPQFSEVSPADPAAVESATSAPAALLTGSGELAEEAVTYSCPVHPERTAREPGKCPICGSALARKAAAPEARP